MRGVQGGERDAGKIGLSFDGAAGLRGARDDGEVGGKGYKRGVAVLIVAAAFATGFDHKRAPFIRFHRRAFGDEQVKQAGFGDLGVQSAVFRAVAGESERAEFGGRIAERDAGGNADNVRLVGG